MSVTSWFESARFGMFVHWGIASVGGLELSWPMVGGLPVFPGCQDVPVATYEALARSFNPTAYDPAEWARLARRAGMRYAILTAKHHDGFALFPTRESDFSVANSPYGRDIVGPFVEAFRAEGLRVGLYFSLIDWHHPDYPAVTDADKPYRFGPWRRPAAVAWERFRRSMFGQVRELLTRYGRIDLLWFDGAWERTPEEWKAEELAAMIRSLQPEILINDRLPGQGDFATPEQAVPARPPGRPFETCMTINESWGHVPADRNFKSTRRLIHTLCEVAGKGGNLLLNVSPTAEGTLPPEQVERLEGIGGWMERHGESIVGTQPGLEPWQFYGPSTRRGDRVYLHLLMKPYETVSVRGIRVKRVRAARMLGASRRELRYRTQVGPAERLFHPDPLGELLIEVPSETLDPLASVIELEIDSPVS